jgi:hypothetical protein
MTFRIGDFVKDIVHGFLNAGVRLMKLARCLRGKLAEHIPVPQGMERVKYTIGAHVQSFSFNNDNFGDDPIFYPFLSMPTFHWMMVDYGQPSCKSGPAAGQAHSGRVQRDLPELPK